MGVEGEASLKKERFRSWVRHTSLTARFQQVRSRTKLCQKFNVAPDACVLPSYMGKTPQAHPGLKGLVHDETRQGGSEQPPWISGRVGLQGGSCADHYRCSFHSALAPGVQMGNAVSPVVAGALGRCLAKAAAASSPAGEAVISVPDPVAEAVSHCRRFVAVRTACTAAAAPC